MSSIKKFVSDTAIYGFTTIVSRMIGFLMIPIYTRKFENAAVMGIYSNFYAWVSMLNAVLAFGMETSYFRFLQKVDEKDRAKVFSTSFAVTLFTSALLLLSVFVFKDPIVKWFAEGENVKDVNSYVNYFTAILITDALAIIPFARLRASGRPIKYSILKFINIVAVVGSNLFFLVFFPMLTESSMFWRDLAEGWFREGWLGYVFISNLIASTLTLLLLLPELFTIPVRIEKKLLFSMVSYSFPILIGNISFIINEHLDKMFFPKLIPGERGLSELGIYNAVSKLAIFLNLFVTAFRLGAEPFFFSHSKNENAQKTYAKIMEYFVILMVIVMVGLCANLDWLKIFIKANAKNPEIYWTGLKIVPVLLLNYVLLGVYMNVSIWYKLTDQTRYAIYIAGFGAVLTVILNLLLIPTYSYVGAALTTTSVYLAMILLSVFWGNKHYPIDYNWKKIGFYLILGLAICFGNYFALDNNMWTGNIFLLVLILFIYLKEKDAILKVLKAN